MIYYEIALFLELFLIFKYCEDSIISLWVNGERVLGEIRQCHIPNLEAKDVMICVHFIGHFKSRVGVKVEEWCLLMNRVQSQDVEAL